jgi:hypothetical protein
MAAPKAANPTNEKKNFFFEKKKQKTFIHASHQRPDPVTAAKKPPTREIPPEIPHRRPQRRPQPPSNPIAPAPLVTATQAPGPL